MFRKNSSLSYAEKPKPVKGIFSVVLAAAAWIICITAVVLSWKGEGNARIVVGKCGIMAMLSAAMGTCFGIGGIFDSGSPKLVSWIGAACSLIVLGGLIYLFAGGF